MFYCDLHLQRLCDCYFFFFSPTEVLNVDLCFVVLLFILLLGKAVLPRVLELRICSRICDVQGVNSVSY